VNTSKEYGPRLAAIALVDVALRHCGTVTLHEVSLFRFIAYQCATLPFLQQKIGNAAAYFIPQWLAIGLEHDPLCAVVDGVLPENTARRVGARIDPGNKARGRQIEAGAGRVKARFRAKCDCLLVRGAIGATGIVRVAARFLSKFALASEVLISAVTPSSFPGARPLTL
jgi:hypothetical protein